MPDSTLFLTLRIFSATGGIEKVSRVIGKALHEMQKNAEEQALSIFSMYDEPGDINEQYFPAAVFKGFGKAKSRFVLAATRQGIKSKVVILSHVNLLLAGYFVKVLSPKTKVILVAHGIEIWERFPAWKKYMLNKCDQVLAVSNYTKSRVVAAHDFPAEKVHVFNNCLDPFLQAPQGVTKSPELMKRYGLCPENKVLITLTRLAFREQYKGYDNVLQAICQLKPEYPTIRYLIVGKYDEAEKKRLEVIIAKLDLKDHIIFTGFIPEEELAAHYNISDCYIMPSKKEGFGIVFIEAMYYGKPVIAGNKDGSVDALDNGNFGLLVDPDNQAEITKAIKKVLDNQISFIPVRAEVMEKFGYEGYSNRLLHILRPQEEASVPSAN